MIAWITFASWWRPCGALARWGCPRVGRLRAPGNTENLWKNSHRLSCRSFGREHEQVCYECDLGVSKCHKRLLVSPSTHNLPLSSILMRLKGSRLVLGKYLLKRPREVRLDWSFNTVLSLLDHSRLDTSELRLRYRNVSHCPIGYRQPARASERRIFHSLLG